MSNSECNQRAHFILNEMGPVDGEKHIEKTILLVNGIKSKELTAYWESVSLNFKKINYGNNNIK